MTAEVVVACETQSWLTLETMERAKKSSENFSSFSFIPAEFTDTTAAKTLTNPIGGPLTRIACSDLDSA